MAVATLRREERAAICRARGNRCQRCNAPSKEPEPVDGLYIHHIRRRRQGEDTDENLLVLCGFCHDEEHIFEARMGWTYRHLLDRMAECEGTSVSKMLRAMVLEKARALGLLKEDEAPDPWRA